MSAFRCVMVLLVACFVISCSAQPDDPGIAKTDTNATDLVSEEGFESGEATTMTINQTDPGAEENTPGDESTPQP